MNIPEATPLPALKPEKSKIRQDSIDFIRAIAITAVLLYHYTARFDPSYLNWNYQGPRFTYGYLGVQLFFILSGYCIYLTISRAKSLADFFAKRIARIWPALLVSATITFILTHIFSLPGRVASLFTYFNNVFFLNIISGKSLDGSYWSLVVELRFYILFGVLYAYRKNAILLSWFWFCLCGMTISLLHSFALQSQHPFHLVAVRVTQLLADKIFIYPYSLWFLVGIFIFEWQNLRQAKKLLFLSPVAIYLVQNWNRESLILLGLCLFSFFLIPLKSFRIPAVVRWIGLISYPVYLVHQNVGILIIRELAPLHPALRLSIVISIIIGVASLIYIQVEKRFHLRLVVLLRQIFERGITIVKDFALRLRTRGLPVQREE